MDPGSELGGWRNKCLMNAVLACARADERPYLVDVFLKNCANHARSGACGSVEEAANLDAVRRILSYAHAHVRVWGCASLQAFHENRVKCHRVLGLRTGRAMGDLVWCEEDRHVYVCRSLCDMGSIVGAAGVPWRCCVVGGADDNSRRKFGQKMRRTVRTQGSTGCVDAPSASLPVNVCLEINSYLAPAAATELLHRLPEGGPVTYCMFGKDGVGEFKRHCKRLTLKMQRLKSRSRCYPHMAWKSQWFARLDEYLGRGLLCPTVEDLAVNVIESDKLIAVWYMCMSRGLRARRVGRARVKARRAPPGCGVRRESRGLRGSCWDAFGSVVKARDSYELSRGCSRKEIVDPGSELGGWRNKCLMNAVLACARADERPYLVDVFLKNCANHARSGACGSVEEAANLDAVRRILSYAHAHVRVWGCASLQAFHENRMNCHGVLGLRTGRLMGDLVWCEEDMHVYVCRGLWDIGSIAGAASRFSVNPWFNSVVGAPKKGTSKRGAHFRKGGATYEENSRRREVERAARGRGGVELVASEGLLAAEVDEVGELGKKDEGYVNLVGTGIAVGSDDATMVARGSVDGPCDSDVVIGSESVEEPLEVCVIGAVVEGVCADEFVSVGVNQTMPSNAPEEALLDVPTDGGVEFKVCWS